MFYSHSVHGIKVTWLRNLFELTRVIRIPIKNLTEGDLEGRIMADDNSSFALNASSSSEDAAVADAAAADDDCSGSVADCVSWFQWSTEGLLILIVGVIGVFGNGVSIWTFSRQRVHRIFHNLLLVLAIFDIVSRVVSFAAAAAHPLSVSPADILPCVL